MYVTKVMIKVLLIEYNHTLLTKVRNIHILTMQGQITIWETVIFKNNQTKTIEKEEKSMFRW